MEFKRKVRLITTLLTCVAIIFSFLVIPIDLSDPNNILGYAFLIIPLFLLPIIYKDMEESGLSSEKKLISTLVLNFTVVFVMLFLSPFTLLFLPVDHQFIAALPIMTMVLVYNMFYFIDSEQFLN